MKKVPTKFLPVAPINILDQLTKRGCIDRFYLAHDVVKSKYREAYINSNVSPLSYTILDNSVIELGGAVNIDIVKDAQSIVQADIVVLPDVLEKSKETSQIVKETYGMWFETFNNSKPKDFTHLMFVPQGETLKDWISCLVTTMNYLEKTYGKTKVPTYIGIPRNTTDRITTSRYHLANIVATLFPYCKIHLLGFSDNFVDDVLSAKHPAVASIDSAVPIRIADHGLSVEQLWHTQPPKRGEWWNTDFKDAMEQNVIQMNQWVS